MAVIKSTFGVEAVCTSSNLFIIHPTYMLGGWKWRRVFIHPTHHPSLRAPKFILKRGRLVCLYKILDDMYKSSTSNEIIVDMFHDIWYIFTTTCSKEEVKVKSCLTMGIRFMWFLNEARLYIRIWISAKFILHMCMIQLQ